MSHAILHTDWLVYNSKLCMCVHVCLGLQPCVTELWCLQSDCGFEFVQNLYTEFPVICIYVYTIL